MEREQISDYVVREEALRQAVRYAGTSDMIADIDVVATAAERFYKFLRGDS